MRSRSDPVENLLFEEVIGVVALRVGQPHGLPPGPLDGPLQLGGDGHKGLPALNPSMAARAGHSRSARNQASGSPDLPFRPVGMDF